jgi:hypothetical protein
MILDILLGVGWAALGILIGLHLGRKRGKKHGIKIGRQQVWRHIDELRKKTNSNP